MEVHTKIAEEQGKLDQLLIDEQREIKSQLTKLTNSLVVQEQGWFPTQPQPNPNAQNYRDKFHNNPK